MENYKIKQIAADFQVSEVLSIPELNSSAPVYIYLLEKSGYRTLEVIASLEKLLKFHLAEKIGFSGLKDEDGITLQHISLPRLLTDMEIELIHNHLCKNDNHYVRIRFFSSTNKHLKVGGLHGNCFKIKVRQLSEKIVREITSKKEHSLLFVNYYGPQRFGLPDQIKNTWKIGEALVKGDFSKALFELQQQSSPEANEARQFDGGPVDYFKFIDKRLLAFFQSSYFSNLWNDNIIRSILELSIVSERVKIDKVDYLVPSNQGAVAKILAANIGLVNKRAVLRDGDISAQEYCRLPVISTKVIVEGSGIDDRNQGSYYCTLSFFLPSGSYASMLIPQFLKYIEYEMAEESETLAIC